MAIDYGLLLSAGTEGVIKKIDGLLSQETDGEKAAFYRTARACMEAIGHHAEKYAEEAERVAATVEDPAGKESLREIAAISRTASLSTRSASASSNISWGIPTDTCGNITKRISQAGRSTGKKRNFCSTVSGSKSISAFATGCRAVIWSAGGTKTAFPYRTN